MTEFRPSRPEDIPKLRQLWKDCFGDSDSFLDLFFSLAYAPERSLILKEGNTLIGAAYWFDCSMADKKMAYEYAIAISPSHQNRGLGTALVEALHAVLLKKGYDAALLVPGAENLRRFYGRLGYRTCSYRQTEVALPSLSPISPAQYARLRRQLLPENGVVQEGENLSFLSALADFYRGEGCIAALSREDGSCLELLGVPFAGDTVPYAMVKSLTNDALPERLYFAFGFN